MKVTYSGLRKDSNWVQVINHRSNWLGSAGFFLSALSFSFPAFAVSLPHFQSMFFIHPLPSALVYFLVVSQANPHSSLAIFLFSFTSFHCHYSILQQSICVTFSSCSLCDLRLSLPLNSPFLPFSASVQGPHQRFLLRELLRDYNPMERPVANDSQALTVQFSFTLMQVMDVVCKAHKCTFNVIMW